MLDSIDIASPRNKVGRPREFDQDTVLSALTELFWENGYFGTSLSEIMKATGLAKASLYGTFGEKRGMYYAALEYYKLRVIDPQVEALRVSPYAPRDRIYRFLSQPLDEIEMVRRRGCFLCKAASDQAINDPVTENLVKLSLNNLEQAICAALEDMQVEQSEHLAATFLSAYSGLRMLASAGISLDQLARARDNVMSWL